ncbi:MAG: hypothetical protein HZA91_17990 [Verrucomicrobia bacterium]|nr:hypothetical protein [Verrucomicrobiota bacterium]
MNPTQHLGIYLLCWLAGLIGLIPLALVLQAVFPRFLRRSSAQLERGPWSSLVVGALGVLICFVAAHVAGRAGFGRFLGSVVLIALTVVSAFGISAAFRSLGGRMYFSMNSPRADLAFPSTLLGGGVLWLAAVLPGLGQVALIVAAVMGFGASLVAWLGKKEQPPPAA